MSLGISGKAWTTATTQHMVPDALEVVVGAVLRLSSFCVHGSEGQRLNESRSIPKAIIVFGLVLEFFSFVPPSANILFRTIPVSVGGSGLHIGRFGD